MIKAWRQNPRFRMVESSKMGRSIHGSLNVPIEHHPTIRYMVYNGYYKVMSNIPKMGHLPTPAICLSPQFLLKSPTGEQLNLVNLKCILLIFRMQKAGFEGSYVYLKRDSSIAKPGLALEQVLMSSRCLGRILVPFGVEWYRMIPTFGG